MSENVAFRRIEGIWKHPLADRLAIVKVGRFQVIHALDEAEQMSVGSKVIHFPPDICLDHVKVEEIGISQYCRPVRCEDGEIHPCRIVAARIRGVPSYGFIILNPPEVPESDLDDYYGVWKYEPVETLTEDGTGTSKEFFDFPKYTNIRRIQLHPENWTEGLPVRVTEKIHGRNTRVGVIKVDGEWQYMVGTHTQIKKEYPYDDPVNFKRNPLWDELLDERMMRLLNDLCDGEHSVVVYGERFGGGLQDLDYGYTKPEFRVFDIMVDGQFLDWDLVIAHCEAHSMLTVPLLYSGSFTWCMVDNLTIGGSTVQNPSVYKSDFKGREGIVITPLKETVAPSGGRLIAKSISVDYDSRHGNKTEYH